MWTASFTGPPNNCVIWATSCSDEDDDDQDDHEVPLVNVKRHVLSKVIEYCKHHVDSPPKEITKVACSWWCVFVRANRSRPMLECAAADIRGPVEAGV